MTDIREAREVMLTAITDGSVYGFGDNATYDEYPDPGQTVDCIIAALSAAGMTICGEQVGWVDMDGDLLPRFRGDEHDEKLVEDGYGPVFVPVLADPQEGDK